MDRADVDWHGVFVPLITPFDEEGRIDEEAYRRLIELSVTVDAVHGLIACGSAGEFYVLDWRERERLCQIAVEQVNGRVPVLAGTSAVRPGDVIALAQQARTSKADGVMILPPYYAMPTEREVVGFFREISDSIRLPIMVYNGPRRTGVNLEPGTMTRLAELERVVAVKESSKDFHQMSALLARCGDRLRVFTGWETMTLGCVAMGADGVVAIVPSAMGRTVTDLYEALVVQDLVRARALQRRVDRFCDVFDIGSDFAVLKEAVNQVGRPGGAPRKPLLPLTPEDRARVRVIVEELGLCRALA